MILFIGQLLLMILLHQPAAGKWKAADSDSSVVYEEFCIRVPDDPPSTSSKPVSQVPTKTTHPTEQPVEVNSNLVQMFGLNSPFLHESSSPGMSGAPSQDNSGCYCNDGNMKQPTETTKVRSWAKRRPTETCSSTEYIEKLADGRQVCVEPFSILSVIDSILRFLFKAPTRAPVTSPPPTESHCKPCDPFLTNLQNIDPKAAQSLDVQIPAPSCPARININMNDSRVFCADLVKHKAVLQKLEILPPHEDPSECPPKKIADGCHCQEKERKLPTGPRPAAGGRIWLPNERCRSAEVVETPVNGSEVCVTICDLFQHFVTLERTYSYSIEIHRPDPTFEISNRVVLVEVCSSCTLMVTIDPKDVESLEMEMPSGRCPTIVRITLTDKTKFCIDSSNPLFKDVLEKLENAAN